MIIWGSQKVPSPPGESFCYTLHLIFKTIFHGGILMVEVSELAREKLLDHLKNSEADLAVRMTVTAG